MLLGEVSLAQRVFGLPDLTFLGPWISRSGLVQAGYQVFDEPKESSETPHRYRWTRGDSSSAQTGWKP